MILQRQLLEHVFITGGRSGIGKAMAIKLAA